MLLYNTLSQKKEPLPDAEVLRLFVCGPTVYDYIHIGNARVYVIFDMFVKYLRSQGHRVSYVQNITDIDDKIITKAKEEKTAPKALATKFFVQYKKNMKDLGVDSVDKYAKATDFIPEIVKQIKKLIQNGNVYMIQNDGWYFNLATFPEYGKLSKRTAEQAEDGVSRIDENPNKKNRGDFCLWKFSKDGEPTWKSDLGHGRPGWHIEDTAISDHFFGPQYEIHGGGTDLMFPHHEAEIAQQESASGKKPFVKLWMHVGMLSVNGKKMSKSLGNVITISRFLKDYPSKLFRFMVMGHHYSTRFDYNPLALEEAKKNLINLQTFLFKLDFAKKSPGKKSLDISNFEKDFNSALEDDFNTPKALGVIFELMNKMNPDIWNLNKASLSKAQSFVKDAFKTFGVAIVKPKIPVKITNLARKREKFRTSKQFTHSDDLRRGADELGYIIEDTPRGPFVWPRKIF